MKDAELFELCKEVYERTEWNPSHWQIKVNPGLNSEYLRRITEEDEEDCSYDELYADAIPEYTSDYLLEKLPRYIELKDIGLKVGLSLFVVGDNGWLARYDCSINNDTDSFLHRSTYGKTPTETLLKLTIALHEAGDVS